MPPPKGSFNQRRLVCLAAALLISLQFALLRHLSISKTDTSAVTPPSPAIDEVMLKNAALKTRVSGSTPQLPRRSRPVVAVHLPHSGGTLLCYMAQLNRERLFRDHVNCNHRNDVGGHTEAGWYPFEPRPCAQRRRQIAGGVTFSAIERGFETAEFCPKSFDYLFIAREPLARMESISALYRGEAPIRMVFQHLAAGNWSLKPYDELKVSAKAELNRLQGGVGYGLAQFDNYMVRVLAAKTEVLHAPLGKITRAHYELARANLKRYAMVVTLPSADESDNGEANTKRRAAFKKPPLQWQTALELFKPKHKINKHHEGAYLGPFERRWLARRNRWDMRLYEEIQNGSTTMPIEEEEQAVEELVFPPAPPGSTSTVQ